jgi:hypothetical protein
MPLSVPSLKRTFCMRKMETGKNQGLRRLSHRMSRRLLHLIRGLEACPQPLILGRNAEHF